MRYYKEDTIKDFLFYIIVALISNLFVYGFELTHFTLSIDEEFTNNFSQTLCLSRWGHALIRHYLLPEPFVPFFTTAISLIILSASSALSALYLKLNRIHSYAFIIMLAALPQFAYQLELNNQADTVAIAILCSVLSLFMLNPFKLLNAIIFVALTVISLSIYQSIFLSATTLLCVWLTLESVRGNFNLISAFKLIVVYCVLVAISIAINAFLTKHVALIFHIHLCGYYDSMIGWGNKSFSEVILNVYNFTLGLFRFRYAYGLGAFTFSAIFFLGIGIFSFINKTNPVLTTILSFITLLCTFILNYALGSALPVRTLTQMPVVFAGLFSIFLVASRLNFSGLVLAIIFLINGAAASNQLFYSDYMARQSDERLASQILNVIDSKYPTSNIEETPVFFYGGYSPYNTWKLPNSESFGASFFDWDSGSNYRISHYLMTDSIIKLKMATKEQAQMASIAGKEMPTWPNRDSVQYHNGVIIVKLGNTLIPHL